MVQSKYTSEQAHQAVEVLYRAILGRPADEGSLKHTAHLLQNGQLSELDIATGLITSPEFVWGGVLQKLSVRTHDPVFLQTSDPFVYQEMLSVTSRTVIAYCKRHNLKYESYIGIKRGYWPWHATYNRIYMLRELLDRGFRGWAIYLDADAFIADQEFDLRAYLADKSDNAIIATLALGHMDSQIPDNGPHNINIGVLGVNLAHPLTPSLLREWFEYYESVPEYIVRSAQIFDADMPSDQQMLHQILAKKKDYTNSIYHESWSLLNSADASFIRQHLRVMHPDFETRLAVISQTVDEILRIDPS